MKTILEWYDTIAEEDIRDRAKRNYSPSFAENHDSVNNCTSLDDAIQNGFLWDSSYEGNEFWSEIFTDAQDGLLEIRTVYNNFEL